MGNPFCVTPHGKGRGREKFPVRNDRDLAHFVEEFAKLQGEDQVKAFETFRGDVVTALSEIHEAAERARRPKVNPPPQQQHQQEEKEKEAESDDSAGWDEDDDAFLLGGGLAGGAQEIEKELKPPNLQLVQGCWDLICAAYLGTARVPKPRKLGNEYELPAGPGKKMRQARKTRKFVESNDAQFREWCKTCEPHIKAVEVFEKTSGYSHGQPLTEEEWMHVQHQVYYLSKLPGEDVFDSFFEEIHHIIDETRESLVFADHQQNKIRLRRLLKKLVPKETPEEEKRETSRLLADKGTCAEIIDLFRAVRFRGDAIKRVAVPKPDKKFEIADVRSCNAYLLKPRNAKQKKQAEEGRFQPLMQQDIDRTEIHDGDIKFYIEVKADPHTAAETHGRGTGQLDRILAVIANRERVKKAKGRWAKAEPAVSIANPNGWLELFTSNTAFNYVERGFWLIIDGQMIHPDCLKAIGDYVKQEKFAEHRRDFPLPRVLLADEGFKRFTASPSAGTFG